MSPLPDGMFQRQSQSQGAQTDDQGVLLQVEHATRYDYGAPVDLAQHVAFLCPEQDATQRLEAFEMQVEPAPLHQGSSFDRFGNHRSFFTVAGAHRRLQVRARSRVRVLVPLHEALVARTLPWPQVRERLQYAAGAAYQPESEFCVPSPYVPRLAALRALAEPSFAPGTPVALAAIDLMHRVHEGFKYKTASTTIDTPLACVLETRRGVCQDFAHLMIGALRMQGLAARYVSGYLLTTPPPGRPALQGADASHAWVSVWCPLADGSAFWLDLDPTNDVLPSTSHVRVAHGRDYGDVTPLRGVIRGGGEHVLQVSVHTERADE
jgi:transglutaminase-like putative cysteine protease